MQNGANGEGEQMIILLGLYVRLMQFRARKFYRGERCIWVRDAGEKDARESLIKKSAWGGGGSLDVQAKLLFSLISLFS